MTKLNKSKRSATPKKAAVKLPDGMGVQQGRDGSATMVTMPSEADGNLFKAFGGSESHDFNSNLLGRVISCVGALQAAGDDQAVARTAAAVSAALSAFKPTDEIEAMLAAQATAMHYGAMECFQRAKIASQYPDMASRLRKDGANLSRGMADMLDALDRKRGKGPQVVRVERVVVHEGGQAIVGQVQAQPVVSAPSPTAAIGQDAPGTKLTTAPFEEGVAVAPSTVTALNSTKWQGRG